ncbi:hypothetical protein DY000_02050773 [Brassica cretica]|uniref:Uncharacterized protein n=1 Tax=Brassica cretica TaxID=69181 RepID=A0ABQ7F020_BRACR|nr:hypothetical protein DY000_02050773 [Brassica cretica]
MAFSEESEWNQWDIDVLPAEKGEGRWAFGMFGPFKKTGPYRRNPSYIRWSGALDEQHSGGESDFRRLDDEGEVEEEAHEETEEEAQEDETAIQVVSVSPCLSINL